MARRRRNPYPHGHIQQYASDLMEAIKSDQQHQRIIEATYQTIQVVMQMDGRPQYLVDKPLKDTLARHRLYDHAMENLDGIAAYSPYKASSHTLLTEIVAIEEAIDDIKESVGTNEKMRRVIKQFEKDRPALETAIALLRDIIK